MKRRYKLLVGSLITGIILVMIFLITKDRKIYYLSLGDFLATGKTINSSSKKSYGDYINEYLQDKEKLEFYTKSYSNDDFRSIDVLNDIKTNKQLKIDRKEITIKNALIKADLVTLSIGANDLYYKFNLENFEKENIDDYYIYVDDVMRDINKLLYELRKACKEQIMVIGFYNPFSNASSKLANTVEPVIGYANAKLENIVLKYDMTFVDIHDMFLANDNYLAPGLDVYPTGDGYYAISKVIKGLIDEKMLAK